MTKFGRLALASIVSLASFALTVALTMFLSQHAAKGSTSALTPPETSSELQRAILVDDFAPQPRQGHQFWAHNRLGGDRNQVYSENGTLDWGKGVVTATITHGTNASTGVWTALNHPIRDHIPINFSSFFPSQIITPYQGYITDCQIDVVTGTGAFLVELKAQDPAIPSQEIIKWSESVTLAGGPQHLQFSLPITLGEIQNLNWLVAGNAGDLVVVDRVAFTATLPQADTPERAFLWSYAMLLNNWDVDSGLTRDHAYFAANEFDNVSASGMQAAAAVMAWRLGFISQDSATAIVTQTTHALLTLPRSCHGLWPHFVRDGQIVPGTEWSSIDTVIAAVALLEAREALGLENTEVEAVLDEINWNTLVLTDGHISHGYWSNCEPIEPEGEGGWNDFGTESWLVNLGYAAATGNVAGFDHTPPTFNGSGFIDELAWLLVPPCYKDQWGTKWRDYSQQAVDCQLAYYRCPVTTDCQSCHDHACYDQLGLFGLSAAEVPDLSVVPITQTYQAFGVGGEVPPNDGSSLLGHAVIVPHYAGVAAPLRPTQSITLWNWIETEQLFTPLNNVESFMITDEMTTTDGLTCTQMVWNALKGSWNLSLQSLGWGRLLAGDDNPLHQAMWTNDMLRRGYTVMCSAVFLPIIMR